MAVLWTLLLSYGVLAFLDGEGKMTWQENVATQPLDRISECIHQVQSLRQEPIGAACFVRVSTRGSSFHVLCHEHMSTRCAVLLSQVQPQTAVVGGNPRSQAGAAARLAFQTVGTTMGERRCSVRKRRERMPETDLLQYEHDAQLRLTTELCT